MASSYYIKAYFIKNEQKPEIRRFTINASPENDVYSELKSKVTLYLDEHQTKDLVLQYDDEDNERITFSSNEELRSAIDLKQGSNTLKVFVILNQSITQENGLNKEHHANVVCDGCEGEVNGFRFKCLTCSDYDLCEKCASTSLHSEHYMIRIAKSTDWNNAQNHHQHLLCHLQNHLQNHHNAKTTVPPAPPSSTVDQSEKSEDSTSPLLPSRKNIAHFRTHIQQHMDTIKANTQTQMKNSKQYLENVGQYLQQALSPFGIDRDYHVDEKKPATTTTTTTTTETTVATQQEQKEEVSTTNAVPTPSDSSVASSIPNAPEVNEHEEQAASSVTPEINQSSKIRTPSEKAIDDCMKHLEGMGFVNVNGALRELVTVKQGDINLVLDAINPRHHQI